MSPEAVQKLLDELQELSQLNDPGFVARTQTARVCRDARHAIMELVQEVRQLNEMIEVLGEQ